MRSLLLLALALALVVGLARADGGHEDHDDDDDRGGYRGRDELTPAEIAEWHDKLYESTNALSAPGGGSSGLRGWAMMTLGMFEAANSIDKKYSFYTVSPSAIPSTINVRKASRRVAAAKAAQVVLDGLFAPSPVPGALNLTAVRKYAHAAQFQMHTGRFNPNSDEYVNGVALGVFVGNAIITLRSTDGHPPRSGAPFPAVPTDWFTYQWGLPYFSGNPQSKFYYEVAPFGVTGYGPNGGAVTYVRPPLRHDAPANSAEAAQFRTEWLELWAYGTSNSTASTRTPETDATARFHDGNFGSQIGNTLDILTSAHIPDRGTDLLRVIALTAMSSNDAHWNHWYWKYNYTNGRPITKYRQVPIDAPNNLGQQRDNLWQPVLPTSQNPEHPSGHASRTGGLCASFRKAWGDSFTFRTGSFSNPSAPARTYTSFSQFQNEVMASRTYGGVHWRTSGPAGKEMSDRVTDYIWANFLKPVSRRP